MARRGVKKRDYEKLDDPTVRRVVELLEKQDTAITKKAACEILHIAYNVKRLGNIIQEYKDRLEYTERRKKQMRGKEFSNVELQDLVISYLSGEGVSTIADRLFRSHYVVINKIKSLNLPNRDRTSDYHNPKMMPEEMVADKFEDGEFAWSTRYNCVVEIIHDKGYSIALYSNTYQIYIFGKYMQFGNQPQYELGKLDVLKGFTLSGDEFKTSQNFNLRIE